MKTISKSIMAKFHTKNRFRVYLLLFLAIALPITSGHVMALEQKTLSPREDDNRAITRDSPYYSSFDSVDSCSADSTGSGITNVSDASSQDSTIYKSGLSSPYILEQFVIHVLIRLSQRYNQPESDFVTKDHVIALVAFAMGEGGDIMNRSVFNPMNLGYRDTQIKSVAYAANGVDGRQSYGSFDEGVEAYARQMSAGTQSRLGYTLSKKNSTPDDFMHALTYYKEFRDNKFWAEASLKNPSDYYNGRMNLVKSVKNNYAHTAGLVIGTPEKEQEKGIYNTDLIKYTDLLQGNSENTSSNSSTDSGITPGNGCVDNTSTSTSQDGSSIVKVANDEYAKNKDAREWDPELLKYTDGNKEQWCADFVSWVYKTAGTPFTEGASGGWRQASTGTLKKYLEKNHTYFDVGQQKPQAGDVAFFNGHVSIVYSYNDQEQTMVTIGGNESSRIRKTSMKVEVGAGNGLVGFGRLGKEGGNSNNSNSQAESNNKSTYSSTEARSLTIVVNKLHGLPSTYTPVGLETLSKSYSHSGSDQLRKEAAQPLERMLAALRSACSDNSCKSTKVQSAYRSYESQKSIYNNKKSSVGQAEADKVSARPGHSEHQLGLAADIYINDNTLQTSFADTSAGKWLASHSSEYGYILRYPEGKTSIHGYQFEPWHFCYIGLEEAKKVHQSGKTLDEYYNVTAGDSYIAIINNYHPPLIKKNENLLES